MWKKKKTRTKKKNGEKRITLLKQCSINLHNTFNTRIESTVNRLPVPCLQLVSIAHLQRALRAHGAHAKRGRATFDYLITLSHRIDYKFLMRTASYVVSKIGKFKLLHHRLRDYTYTHIAFILHSRIKIALFRSVPLLLPSIIFFD